MNSINLKHAALSSVIVYILGILAYVGSFFIPLMNDPALHFHSFARFRHTGKLP